MGYRDELLRLKIYGKQVAEKKVYHIPKISPKRQLQIVENKVLLAQDKIFYKEIWDASPHICEQCKMKLPNTPLTLFFHHALPKRNYPQFRHTHENIIIVCTDCHKQSESDLDKVPTIKKRTEQIKALLQK